MKRLVLPLLSAVLLHANPTAAADRRFEVCMDNAAGVTSEMLSCIGLAQHQADQRLSETLRKALAPLSPPRREALKRSQSTWVAYREAHCGFLADPDGGTSAALVAADCWLTATRARLVFLETLVDHDTVLLR